jgi:acetylornithine deacetylase
MKSFIAIALALVPEMVERRLARPLHFALSYDEEVGCIGVRRLIADLQCRLCSGRLHRRRTDRHGAVIAHKGQRSYSCRVRG